MMGNTSSYPANEERHRGVDQFERGLRRAQTAGLQDVSPGPRNIMGSYRCQVRFNGNLVPNVELILGLGREHGGSQ